MSHTVAVIGDSLTYEDGNGVTDVKAALVAKGFINADIYFHALGGKTMTANDSGGTTTMQDVTEAKSTLGYVERWIIALGTNNVGDNDTTFRANMRTVLNSIGTMGRVYWIGLGFKGSSNTNAAHFNPIIKEEVEKKAGATYCDWQNHIHNGRNETGLWSDADSTHMTTTGYAIRNAFYADSVFPVLEPWYWDGAGWLPTTLAEWDGSAWTRLGLKEYT